MEALGPDLAALARGHGAPLARWTRLGPAATRTRRATFRLEFADGAVRKGRRLAGPEAARRVEAIVARLDPARFPRVVARRGAALLEAWVDGRTLAAATAAELRWAGETLAGVHATPPPRGLAAPRPPSARLAADLAWLVAAGALPADEAARLRALPPAPVPAVPVLVHRDLCPENVVRGRRGLVVVDNAAARGGEAEEDLARVFYRWPLDAAGERAFLAGYATRADPGPFLDHRAFWTAVALAHAARVRRTRGYAGADAPLRQLCSASPTAAS